MYNKKNNPTLIVERIGIVFVSILPWAVVILLLWAGFFVKPSVTIKQVDISIIEERDKIFGVSVVDDNNIWISGNRGKIIKSDNGGLDWRLQLTETDAHLQDISAWDNQRAVAVGNSGVVLITENGGEKWKAIETPKAEIADKLIRVHTYKNGEAWAVGEFGKILKTNNYGVTWKKMREFEDFIINDIQKIDQKTLIVVGEFGKIMRSEDYGLSWSDITLNSDISSSLTAVEFSDEKTGVAVGLDGTVIYTQDAGVSWSIIEPNLLGTSEHLMDVAWNGADNVWFAVGNKGVWLSISGSLDKFDTGSFDNQDLSWHTEVEVLKGDYVTVGANVLKYNWRTKIANSLE